MDRRRQSIVSGGFGLAFVALGYLTTPGIVSRTVVACATVDDPAFRGVSGVALVWYDGCNEWFVSAFAALGAVLLVVSALSRVAIRLGSDTEYGEVDAADEWP